MVAVTGYHITSQHQTRITNDVMTNSCCSDNLPVCILHLGENGLEKYRLAKKWEQFKIVLLFMDHPVVFNSRSV